MTVSSSTRKVSHSGDGATVTFAVPFYFLADSHLLITQRDLLGVETEITTGFTVSGALNPAGGSVTFSTAPISGYKITISGDVPYTQGLDLPEAGLMPAPSVEQQFDWLTMLTQQLKEQIDRSAKVPITSSISSLELPDASADKVIGWNSAGTALENKTPNVNTYISLSAFGATLIDDTSAAAALATLGAFGAVKIQTFAASGTYTPDANLIYADILVIGGGGGGGGTQTGFSGASGGGGGAGGWARKIATATSIGSSQTVTVGAGGAGGASGGGTGAGGGVSSVGSLCATNGGAGGASSGAAANPSQAGAGGTGTIGDVVGKGGNGQNGIGNTGSSNIPMGGNGGDSIAGRGGLATVLNGDIPGVAGSQYGGGGSGASSKTNGQAGGAGASGVAYIIEYCSS